MDKLTAITPESLNQVLNHHLAGGSFEYKSFDYHAAVAEYRATDERHSRTYIDIYGKEELVHIDRFELPEEIKEKHSFWRHGKLRRVEFTPSGSIYRLYIGARYAKPFYGCNLVGLRLVKEVSGE